MMTTDRLIQEGYRYFAPRGVTAPTRGKMLRLKEGIRREVLHDYLPTRLIVEAKLYPRASQLNNQRPLTNRFRCYSKGLPDYDGRP